MSKTSHKDYDNMSREELMNIVGEIANEFTSREDLIKMAKERSTRADNS